MNRRLGRERRGLRAVLAGLLLGVAAVAGAGCGDTGMVGRRVDNFTAYYNTFHNANTAFEEGVERIEDSNRPIDRDVYLSLFLQAEGSGSQAEAFENAVNKSADVLRDHPTSKWVDDALLLIGKSYYYQGNYVGAAQKFREVVGLETGKEGEARFWLARTLVASDQFEEAARVLSASLADEQDDFGTWTDRMYLARGQLYVRQGRWGEAEAALARGLRGDLPDDLAARASFLLGQVRETRANYLAAAAAYDQAVGHNPRYELDYAARYSAIRARGLHGDTERALQQLRSMERNDKNYDKRFELRLLRAQLLREQGRADAARETLHALMYGRESATGGVKGRAHYVLGLLYRDAYNDFSTAAAHFDSAATSINRPRQSGPSSEQYTPAAVDRPGDLAERYGTLADKAEAVARLDSLLRLGQLPEDAFRQRIAEIRAEQRAEAEAAAASRQQRASASRFESRGATFDDRRRGGAQNLAAQQAGDSGFLFHQNPTRVQEGKRSFRQTWGNRPLEDNWRRIAAVRGGGSVQAEAAPDGRPAQAERARPQTGAGLDLSAVPRDSVSQAEMRRQRALARYELANALFLSAQRPDSAAVWYRTILEEDADQPVARRALYALAEVRSAQGDTDAARRLYRQVLEQYPESAFADRARRRLNLAGRAPTDSSAVLEERYQQAYDLWQQGQLDRALTRMADLARQYPDAEVAPRALLASGLIYLEQLRRDAQPVSLEPLRGLLATADTAAVPADSAGVRDAARASDSTGAGGRRPDPTTARTPLPDSPAPDSTAPDSTAPESPVSDSGAVDSGAVDTVAASASEADPTASQPVADSLRGESAGLAALDAGRRDSTRGIAVRIDTTGRASVSERPVRQALAIALFERLSETYPDTPQGRRAASLLSMMRAAPADSTVADSAATDAPVPDSLAAGATGADTTGMDSTRAGRAGEGQRVPAQIAGDAPSAWTIVVGTYDNVSAASRQADRLRAATNEQFTVDVETTGGEPTRFRITLGRFDSQREAAAARARLREDLPGGVSIEPRPRSDAD